MDITFSLANTLVQNALKIAQQRDVAISVAVTDAHGELVAFARMDGASYHSGVLAQAKAYTSARDRQPSGNLGQWAQETGKDMGYWADSKITGIAGGLPVSENQQVIGGIGVSGLSEQEDEALAAAALKA